MRLPQTLLLAAGVVVSGIGVAFSDEILTDTVQAHLNQKYPGWVLSPINRDAERVFKEGGWRGTPNAIWGDFDGDQQTDYAVQIQVASGTKEMDLVLLRRGNDFEETILGERPAGEMRSLYFLRPIDKSEKLSNYFGKAVHHETDAIELNTLEKEATAFLYNRKKHTFKTIRTLQYR